MVQYKILGPGIQPASQTPAQTELRIHGTDEVLVVPVVTSTKVLELKEMLSMKLGIYPNDLQIFTRAGGYWRLQMDHEEIGRKVRVKGIKSFTPEWAQYEHPFLIIGAGHIGLRHGIYLLQHDHPNFVIVDRRDKVGGDLMDRAGQQDVEATNGAWHIPLTVRRDQPRAQKHVYLAIAR